MTKIFHPMMIFSSPMVMDLKKHKLLTLVTKTFHNVFWTETKCTIPHSTPLHEPSVLGTKQFVSIKSPRSLSPVSFDTLSTANDVDNNLCCADCIWGCNHNLSKPVGSTSLGVFGSETTYNSFLFSKQMAH